MTSGQVRWRLSKRLRREALCAAAGAVAVGAALFSGCITKPQNPSATQPATALDAATTQPTYWLSQPAVAQVRGHDFDRVWSTCQEIARSYGFALDRVDYRSGEISTVPMISKQWFEPWRGDSGTGNEVFANSLGAIRRTLIFEIVRNADESYTITPKILVEREVILEHRVTDVSQYRLAFSGPGTKILPREAVNLDPSTYPDIPIKYWYPISRDPEMERKVADRVASALQKKASFAGTGSGPTPVTQPAPPSPLQADGVISALGPDQTLYINLGAADHVVPGMTFEVYDARATLPAFDAYGEHNPGSRGWIEIVSVGNGSSACRILRAEGNTPPRQGDQIFNFIYARGRQNHFVFAGDVASFDRATLSELVTRWNGVLDPAVSPRTDYVVLGMAPADEAGRRAYDAARTQAAQLKIPVIDENRFNLLVRYYNPSKR